MTLIKMTSFCVDFSSAVIFLLHISSKYADIDVYTCGSFILLMYSILLYEYITIYVSTLLSMDMSCF